MAQLSNFANVTSVLGAADIVIRSAKALYGFMEQIATAPEDRLLVESTLEKVNEAVSGAQKYAKQYRSSVYVVEDSLEPLEELENLLKTCDSEIKQLHNVIKAFTLVPRTMFQDLRLLWGYVSREEAIKKACDRLQGQMVLMMLNLKVTSGKHDIILREKVKAVDRNIANVLSQQDKGFQASQQVPYLIGSFHTENNIRSGLPVDEVSRHLIPPSSTMMETTDISFKGRGLEYLIVPLSQVPLYLPNVFQTLILERRILSRADRDWICTELTHLLASAHEAAARSLRNSKQTSVSNHHFLSLMPMDCETGGRRTKIATSTFYKHFPETGAIGTSRFHGTVKTPGIFLLLSRGWESVNSPPQLTRFVHEVNVVSYKSEVFQCVRRNDVAGLRRLFAAREASPFDYTEYGRSLLCEAALGLNLEFVELLLEQGADSVNCHLGSSNLTDLSYVIWRNYFFSKISYSTIRKHLPLTAKAIGQRFGIDWGCELEKISEGRKIPFNDSESSQLQTILARLLHQKCHGTIHVTVLDYNVLEVVRKWHLKLCNEGDSLVEVVVSYYSKRLVL
ncbi:hypothetical protein BGW36DRAFT_423457 [Talaromyces proteolyticus]|uniref:Uncharacterized protein n=1 Tax=Talaromyces proteolyticus TaxID=1131652 RepID=A0AAD4KYJ8_9EURO|nr:uncharacterized protein BGW36DRAFT_423457 [Talaromyces proteolyticus]KAH8703916.1 hypothetical protein BGW36DRAFT_423457 [Talaromyces proteolyticus]